MAYRKVMVINPAEIRLKNRQLLITTDWEPASIPVEDVDVLLIESQQSIISAAALTALSDNGSAVLLCDEKHMPCAVLLPYSRHSRQAEIMERQLQLTLPRKKRLWQQIVTAKIENQAKCLALRSLEDDAVTLRTIGKTVRSGDAGNAEATAAVRYFPALFGSGFTRGNEEDVRNAALNYGYAILRGAVARSVAVHGFLPCMGLHHHNGLNAFNLADDLIEPFRPVVDAYVARVVWEDDTLTTKGKRELFDLLNTDMLSGGQRHTVTNAIERLVQSLARCIPGETETLLTPQQLAPQCHRYA